MQSNTKTIQDYLINRLKELVDDLNNQALNQQTLQNIIEVCQDAINVQTATDALEQAQQEYIEFCEQSVPEVVTAEVVANHQAEHRVLQARLLRAYDVYTDLAIPVSMHNESIWTYDTLVKNLHV